MTKLYLEKDIGCVDLGPVKQWKVLGQREQSYKDRTGKTELTLRDRVRVVKEALDEVGTGDETRYLGPLTMLRYLRKDKQFRENVPQERAYEFIGGLVLKSGMPDIAKGSLYFEQEAEVA